MKVLVIGLNPSRLNGKSPTIKKLYKWLDCLNLDKVSFTNIYGSYDIDPLDQNNINVVKNCAKEYDKVLALGKMASHSLQTMDIPHFGLPHPSGLNRKLNDEKYIHDRLQACKNYLQE